MPSSGYTAITFVANEQPTTAKWNLIGSNDASFNNGNGFNDAIIINRHIADDAVKGNNLLLDTVQSDWVALGNFTTSSTSYQDAGFKITLPAIGTWLLLGQVRSLSPGAGNFGVQELYNFTAGAAIPQTTRLASYGSAANERQHPPFFAVINTATVNNQVGIRHKSGGAYSTSIENDAYGFSSLLAVRIG